VADPTRGNTAARARGGVARRSEEGAVRAGERRGDIIEGGDPSQPLRREELGTAPQAFAIPKPAVFEAWQRVKANRGAAGRDGESLAAVEQQLRGKLYRVWNRLGELFSAASQGGRDSEGGWWGTPAGDSDGGRSGGTDRSAEGAGAAPGTAL
jgi:hypothetical protein